MGRCRPGLCVKYFLSFPRSCWFLNNKIYSYLYHKKPFGTWQFCRFCVLVNFITQKLKSKHLLYLIILWWQIFFREREKIFYAYSGHYLSFTAWKQEERSRQRDRKTYLVWLQEVSFVCIVSEPIHKHSQTQSFH